MSLKGQGLGFRVWILGFRLNLEVMRLKGEGRQLVPRAYNGPLLHGIAQDAVPNLAALPEILEHQ